jgi:hypothetical protein
MNFVETSLLRIGYEAGGPPDGPRVLLLHGRPDDPRGFSRLVPLLENAGFQWAAPLHWLRMQSNSLATSAGLASQWSDTIGALVPATFSRPLRAIPALVVSVAHDHGVPPVGFRTRSWKRPPAVLPIPIGYPSRCTKPLGSRADGFEIRPDPGTGGSNRATAGTHSDDSGCGRCVRSAFGVGEPTALLSSGIFADRVGRGGPFSGARRPAVGG